MELIDADLVLVGMALFGLLCLVAFGLALVLDRAQDWAFDVEDIRWNWKK